MPPQSKGVLAAWILGGLTLASLLYMFFFGPEWLSWSKTPRIKNAPDAKKKAPVEEIDPLGEEEEDEDEEEEEEEEEEQKGVKVEDASDDEAERPAPASSTASPVRPTSSTTSTEAREDSEDDVLAKNKAKYESLSKECSALIAAQNFPGAVEKLTELISLAAKVPRGQAELVTLYNNRSAMHEKLRDYDKCLSDINIMLLMQPDHIRARTRRARVFEAQEKWREAAYEYVTVNWIEQARQEKPTTEGKAAPLFKKVGLQDAQTRFAQVLSDVSRFTSSPASSPPASSPLDVPPPVLSSTTSLLSQPLPSTAYMMNTLEAFPNSSSWLWCLEKTAVQGLQSALKNETDPAKQVQLVVQIAQVLIAQEDCDKAFSLIREYETVATALSSSLSSLPAAALSFLSLYYEILGIEAVFRRCFGYALQCWTFSRSVHSVLHLLDTSLSSQSTISLSLRLAALYLELQREEEALEVYAALHRDATEVERQEREREVIVEDDDSSTQTPKQTQPLDEAFSVSLEYTPEVVRPLGQSLSSPLSRSLSPSLSLSAAQIPRVMRAWVAVHEVGRVTSRDKEGNIAAEKIEEAVKTLEDIVNNLEGESAFFARSVSFVAQLRLVNVLTHTKAAMEAAPTEAETEKCRNAIQSMKLLRPAHPTLLLLEAEQLAHEGDISAAHRLLERAQRRRAAQFPSRFPSPSSSTTDISDTTDVVYLITQASVLSAEAFLSLSQGQLADAQRLFSVVQQLYERALTIEPTAIEVHAQLAQLLAMVFGNFPVALAHIEKAIEHYRAREELQDLCQMRVTFMANVQAMEVLKEISAARQG